MDAVKAQEARLVDNIEQLEMQADDENSTIGQERGRSTCRIRDSVFPLTM